MMPVLLAIIGGMCAIPGWQFDNDWARPQIRLAIIWAGLVSVVIAILKDPEKRKDFHLLLKCPITWFMATYFLAGGLSQLHSLDRPSCTVAIFYRINFGLIPWFTGAFIAKRPRDWFPAMIAYLVISLPLEFYCLNIGISSHLMEFPGNNSTFHRNNIADTCVTATFMALSFFLVSKQWRVKLPLLASTVISFGALITNQSRASMICLFVGMFMNLMMLPVRKLVRWTVVIATCLAVLGAIALVPEDKLKERTDTSGGSSFAARPLLWQMTMDYLSHHPFQSVGWGVHPRTDTNQVIDNYCNNFLQDYIEAGILGVIGGAGLYACSVLMAIRQYRVLPGNSPAAAMNCIALAVIVQAFIHGSVDMFIDNIYEHEIVFYLMGYLTYTTIQRQKYVEAALQSYDPLKN